MNHPHYELVEKAIQLLSDCDNPQYPIDLLAQRLEVSPTQLQRLFKLWAGLTPKQFVQVLSRNHTLRAIQVSKNIFEASQEAGFSGPGRLHDFTVKLEAATPGEIKSKGEGMSITWDIGTSPFGPVFCAQSKRGICALDFLNSQLSAEQALEGLVQSWQNALISRVEGQAQAILTSAFEQTPSGRYKLWIKASPLQLKVWRALIALPPGVLISYGDLANHCGTPRAARAVGTAVASNSIGWFIPCHRVIRQTGQFGQYKWQTPRKAAMHAWETGKFTTLSDKLK